MSVPLAPPLPLDTATVSRAESEINLRLEAIRRDAQEEARRRSMSASNGARSTSTAPVAGAHAGSTNAPPPPPHLIVLPVEVSPPPHVNGASTANGASTGNGLNGHSAVAVALDAPTIAMEPIVVVASERSTSGAVHFDNGGPGALHAQTLSAWFGQKKVLDRCSLDMPAGKVTAIIGPSGCGKSVFLRNLNRMHEVIPTAKMGGLVTLDGVDIHSEQMNVTEARLRIGMVFQRPNPFPSMSIKENVLAGLKLAGLKNKGKDDDLVEWCLRRAGLWNETKDRLGNSGAALSGGQQQRLCIARALAVRPKVLLMDEPCSALDPISTRVIEETIIEIAPDVTVVIVTHNMQQAQRVADTCAFFMIDAIGQPGRIVEAGPTEQIFGNPIDQRTSDYVTGRFG